MKKQLFAGAALAALAVFAFAGPAHGANEYTGSLSSNTAAPGATLSYTAANTGFPDTEATVTVDPDVVFLAANTATYTTSSTGALNFSFQLPGTAAIGQTFVMTVTAGEGAGNFEDTETITIVALPADDGTALTGVDPAPYLWFGIGLVVLGAGVLGVLVVSRRNRARAPGQ